MEKQIKRPFYVGGKISKIHVLFFTKHIFPGTFSKALIKMAKGETEGGSTAPKLSGSHTSVPAVPWMPSSLPSSAPANPSTGLQSIVQTAALPTKPSSGPSGKFNSRAPEHRRLANPSTWPQPLLLVGHLLFPGLQLPTTLALHITRYCTILKLSRNTHRRVKAHLAPAIQLTDAHELP